MFFFCSVSLEDVLSKSKPKLRYIYDLGDRFSHSIELQKIKVLPTDRRKSIPLVRIIGGERSGPPENVSGNYGYHSLLLYLQTYELGKDILSFIEEYAQRIRYNNGFFEGENKRWFELNEKLTGSEYHKKMNDMAQIITVGK